MAEPAPLRELGVAAAVTPRGFSAEVPKQLCRARWVAQARRNGSRGPAGGAAAAANPEAGSGGVCNRHLVSL